MRVEDKAFVRWCHEHFGCLVAERGFGGCWGVLTFHHVRSCGSARDDRRGLMLCAGHHLHDGGRESLERMGRENWQAHFDISIEAEVRRNQVAYLESGHRFKVPLELAVAERTACAVHEDLGAHLRMLT